MGFVNLRRTFCFCGSLRGVGVKGQEQVLVRVISAHKEECLFCCLLGVGCGRLLFSGSISNMC